MKLLILSCLALAVIASRSVAADKAEPAKTGARVFEMRTYYAAPGKMNDLHARFRNHSIRMFEKHGIGVVGFWVPTDAKGADEVVIYILSHASEEAAKKSWDAIRADEEWKKIKAESEKNGPLLAKPPEAKFLKATDYSKIK